jgi:hypothetical protein
MLNKAKKAVDNIFFVGLQEVYDFSVELLLREFRMKIDIDLPKERSESSKAVKDGKRAILSNKTLLQKARLANSFDALLYKYGMVVSIVL